jgi:hypothetical protein
MGVAEIDNETVTVTISAHIICYGTAASQQIATQIAADINTYWNIENGFANINGSRYKVEFNITGYYAPQLHQTDVNANDDPLNNYFRIEEHASGNISFVDGINSNTGYFQLDNLLNNSTTAAHEFGHTIGLAHPEELDIRGKGTPGIMYPRGTVTDPHFQYDPEAAPQTKGGTLNPYYRKVLQNDINDLHIENLHFNSTGKAVIGDFTSEWHYRHVKNEE